MKKGNRMRLIDADALKNHIESYYDKVIFVSAVKCLIDNSPTIEAESVKHGHWSKEMVGYADENGNFHFGYQCSQCKAILNKTKRCGECGAIMDEVEDDEEVTE